MSDHLTELQIECYRDRRVSPGELLAIDKHTSGCSLGKVPVPEVAGHRHQARTAACLVPQAHPLLAENFPTHSRHLAHATRPTRVSAFFWEANKRHPLRLSCSDQRQNRQHLAVLRHASFSFWQHQRTPISPDSHTPKTAKSISEGNNDHHLRPQYG